MPRKPRRAIGVKPGEQLRTAPFGCSVSGRILKFELFGDLMREQPVAFALFAMNPSQCLGRMNFLFTMNAETPRPVVVSCADAEPEF